MPKPRAVLKFQKSAVVPIEKKTVDFTHPATAPLADEMVLVLSDLNSEQGFGPLGLQGSRAWALRTETELYNAWVQAQCTLHGLRSPGQLSPAQFSDRYWVKPAKGGA